MRVLSHLAVVVVGLLLSLPALAGITAQIDKRSATLDDRFVLTATIDGDVRTQPQLPDLEAFEVFSRGQSTRMSIINGRQSMAIEFTWILVPKRTGRFTIGPITAQVGGAREASQPFTIEVLEASATPPTERTLFATATVSDDTPYVGQPITYTFRFFHRVRFNNASLEQPDFNGFTVHDLGEQRDYETTVGGQGFRVVEIRKSLIPQRAGTLEIPPMALNLDVIVQRQSRGRGLLGMFGSYESESKVIRTEPVEVKVQALPRAPAHFSGLVGEFTLAAGLTRTELAAGESTTLEVTVKGTGNAVAIPEPYLGDLSAFKVYDDKPTGSLDTKGKALAGSRTFRKSLVPMAAGEPVVGPIELVWFDPERGEYRTATKGPFTLSVSPPAEGEELNLTEGLLPGSGKVAVRVVGEDIVPIYRRLDALPSMDAPLRSGVLGAALAFPPLGFLVLEVVRRRRERWGGDAAGRRRRGAYRKAKKALSEAGALTDPAASAEARSRALREYLGDKLGREGGALTPSEARAAALGAGVDAELAADLEAQLEWAEALRYSGGGGGAGTEDRFSALLDRLDRGLK